MENLGRTGVWPVVLDDADELPRGLDAEIWSFDDGGMTVGSWLVERFFIERRGQQRQSVCFTELQTIV